MTLYIRCIHIYISLKYLHANNWSFKYKTSHLGILPKSISYVHISVLNGALWDMGHVHCGIYEIGLLYYRIRGYFQVVNVIAKKFRKQWITGISIHVCVWSHELTKRTILSYQKGQGKTYIYTLIRPLTSKHWHVLGDHKIYLLETCIVLLFRLWYRCKFHESEVIDVLVLVMKTFALCKTIDQALTQNINVILVSILCNSASVVVMCIKMRTCIVLLCDWNIIVNVIRQKWSTIDVLVLIIVTFLSSGRFRERLIPSNLQFKSHLSRQ